MKRRYYVVLGRNRFAESFASEVEERVSISVRVAAQNRKLNGCRVFEIPTDRLYTSEDDIAKVGERLMPYLKENDWIDEVCRTIKKDCKRLKRSEVVINFIVTNRCKYSKTPGFIFYWEARSKRR